jgi:hypothetical protein
VLEDGFRDQRDILDIANASDGAGAASGSVHAAGIEFDDPFFVRKTAEADAGIVGIVFRPFDNFEGSIQCVSAVSEEGEGVIEVVEAVVGADNDGALVRSGLGFLRGGVLRRIGLGSRSYSGRDCA